MNPIAQGLGIGIISGLVLFFVCARLGYIEKLMDMMDRWFK